MPTTKTPQELEWENKLLHEILDNVSDGVYAVTKDGQIIVYNKTMEKIEGTDRKFVLGYKDTEVYNIFSTDQYLRSELTKTGKNIKNRRLTYHMATGYKVEMVTNAYVYSENHDITAVYCVMQDISNINRLQERIISLNSLLNQSRD
ncbi:MAG: PAS domain S-box protein, partial [Bacillota bacterium]|nr:PAS domain S-box protein [Bacillota bacterium]